MAGGRNGSWKDTALSLKVKRKLLSREMTITDLARDINVSQSYLSQVLYGMKPGARCIKDVKLALDIKDTNIIEGRKNYGEGKQANSGVT